MGFFDVQTPLQTPIQTPLPGPGETPSYNIPTGPSDYSSGNDTGGNADLKGGRTGPYMVKFIFFYCREIFTC
jgi:transcription initiation factor TFIIA large subunit